MQRAIPRLGILCWHRSGSTKSSPGLAYVVALTLALLNPIACLIHCAAMDARDHGMHAHAAQSSAEWFYLCDMLMLPDQPQITGEGSIQLPLSLPAAAPRAVYEGVALTALVLIPFWLLITALLAYTCPLSGHIAPPLTPPPRAA
jgi:hypothetical protein